MTDQPAPISRRSLPCIPSPEWEFHTWFPLPDGGGDMVPGQRQRGIVVRRRVTYGDWEPVTPDRWADEPEASCSPAGEETEPNNPADPRDAEVAQLRALLARVRRFAELYAGSMHVVRAETGRDLLALLDGEAAARLVVQPDADGSGR